MKKKLNNKKLKKACGGRDRARYEIHFKKARIDYKVAKETTADGLELKFELKK